MFYVTFKISIGGKHKANRLNSMRLVLIIVLSSLSITGVYGLILRYDAGYFFLGLNANHKKAKIKMNKQTTRTPP